MKLSLLSILLVLVGFCPANEPTLTFFPLGALEKVTSAPVRFPSEADALRCNESADQAAARRSPHAEHLFEVFVDVANAEAYLDPWGSVAAGGLVVKQKLAGKSVVLYTGMVKREPGYFPEGGDWEYFTADAAGAITSRGKLAHCASCHEQKKERDFLFRLPESVAGRAQLTSGKIVLQSSQIVTHGEKLQYEPQKPKNTLGYWIKQADWAEWEFQLTAPGEFDVTVWQGCGTKSGGSEVELAFSLMPEEKLAASVKFSVQETGHFQKFIARNIGSVTLSQPGRYTVKIRALSKPGAAVGDFRKVVLTPRR